MIVLYGASVFGLGRLFPPLSPTSSAEEIAGFLVDHKIVVRLGIAGALSTAAIAFPFLATLALRIRRAEGRFGVLSITQLLASAVYVPALMYPLTVLAAAAFRPDTRPAEITLALSDVFWLMFIGIVGTLVTQNITLAVATFADTATPATFPRWYGYYNLWAAILQLPGCVVVVFNNGPLAWNGIFAFYIPGAVAIAVWPIVSTYVLLGSIRAEEETAEPAAAA